MNQEHDSDNPDLARLVSQFRGLLAEIERRRAQRRRHDPSLEGLYELRQNEAVRHLPTLLDAAEQLAKVQDQIQVLEEALKETTHLSMCLVHGLRPAEVTVPCDCDGCTVHALAKEALKGAKDV